MKPSHVGIARIGHAFINTKHGFKAAWRHEAAFRQELLGCAVLVPLAFWVGSGAVEIALLLGVCGFVLTVELLNTGIEAVVDRVGPELHDLSKIAKDVGSAAVFVSLVVAGVVWGLIIASRVGWL